MPCLGRPTPSGTGVNCLRSLSASLDAKYAGTGSGTSRDMLPALHHEPLARSTHAYCRAGAVLVSLLQARLVALVASQQLSIPMQDMEERLDALMVMLPDLGEHQGRS